MNSQIRVLVVVMNLKVANGVSSYAMNYFRHLTSKRIHMDFIIYHDENPFYQAEILSRGSRVYVLPSIKRISEHIASCKKILREGRYDVIHDNCLLITLPLMMCAKRLGIAVRILHSHSCVLGENSWKAMRNYVCVPFLKLQTNAAFACSEMAGRSLWGSKEFTIIPNAIETSVYRRDMNMRQSVRGELCVGERYVIGSVGRIAEAKNPFFAIEVFKQLHKEHPETVYWWIGTGPLDMRVKEYVERQGLKDSIVFFGNRSDTPRLYQAFDVLLMPSLNEGFGLSAVEAQMAGCRCVLSDRIPKEVECSNLVRFCSLKASASQWASVLWESIKRAECETPVIDWSKYEITHCVSKLSDSYEDLLYKLI